MQKANCSERILLPIDDFNLDKITFSKIFDNEDKRAIER